jgi:hypothetical protein
MMVNGRQIHRDRALRLLGSQQRGGIARALRRVNGGLSGLRLSARSAGGSPCLRSCVGATD